MKSRDVRAPLAILPRGARARLGLLTVVVAVAASVFGVGSSATARSSAHAAAGLRLVPFTKVDFPTYVVSTPADRTAVYVLERTGRIWVVRYGKKLKHPFLDLHRQIRLAANSEQGLISLAFSPDYAKSHLLYVYYTNRQGNIRLKQFRRSRTNPNRVDPSTGRTILALRHPQIDHYAGQLQFGPDGYLYVGIGDGGGVGDPANHAQHLNNLFGKILRIQPLADGRRRYRIPKSNPFAHRHGAKGEIFAYGLRNPFHFSFGPSGGMWIGDVGQDKFEEIDYRAKGRLAGSNFGWSRYEGDSLYNAGRTAFHPIFPVIVEAHSGASGTHENWCAVMGGYVVTDPSLHSLDGHYLFADHCTGRIYQTRLGRSGRAFGTGYTGLTAPALVTSFGVDAHRHVYVAAENGWVYRIER